MKVLFYFGHPAQYLFLRPTLRDMQRSGDHQITIVIKTKDVLESLLKQDGMEYLNILPQERGRSKLAIGMSLLKRNLKLIPVIRKRRPQLLVGTDASMAQLGKLFGINRITITEDDYPVIKTLGRLTYPFTQTILCPEVCSVGAWQEKKIGYRGYMKLAYLHPSVFVPDEQVLLQYNLSKPYALIRLAKLTAHHDFGIQGISNEVLDRLIAILERKGYQVILSSEAETDKKYQKHLLRVKVTDMHQLLYHASMLISDSQSMSVEAAMMGVPSLRLSDFAGKISVLEELENTYQLTFAFKPGSVDALEKKLDALLDVPHLKEEFAGRRMRMLDDKINVSAFLTWFITQYPKSSEVMQQDPEFQLKFK